MLKIDLEVGESVRIGDHATVTLQEKSGKRARLSFEADRSIPIEKTSGERPKESRIAAALGLGEKATA